jgi:hypothetical protein
MMSIFNYKACMAVTRLERKVKRNRINAVKAQSRIKQLLRKPVIKNVDIEAIKASFAAKKSALLPDESTAACDQN